MRICSVDVPLPVPAEHVVAFARRVDHLPAWSGFFTSVGVPVDGRYPVHSLAGPIDTWIEHWSPAPGTDRLTICSLIRDRLERAVLDVTASGDGCRVRFEVTLLADPPPEQVRAQRSRMVDELAALGRAAVRTEQAPPASEVPTPSLSRQ